MSGIVAAAQSSGCCCRPLPCQCTSLFRPGAVSDRMMSMVALSADISVDWVKRNNSGSLNGFCGDACRCRWDTGGAGIYQYQRRGNSIRQTLDERCFGCTVTGCPSCPQYVGRATHSGATLLTVLGGPEAGAPYSFQWWTSHPTDQVIGQWSWRAGTVGYCTDPDSHPYRVRPYCPFDLVSATAGGLTQQASVDPNGAYINPITGAYTQGRWGTNIGLIYFVGGATVTVPSFGNCSYRLKLSIVMKSFASLRDTYADQGPVPLDGARTDGFYGAVPLVEYTYVKPCRSVTDTVIGTYELEGQADFDSYAEDPFCGPFAYLDEMRISAASIAEIS